MPENDLFLPLYWKADKRTASLYVKFQPHTMALQISVNNLKKGIESQRMVYISSKAGRADQGAIRAATEHPITSISKA